MTHMFNTAVAMEYGVNAAIILENISFWIQRNEANGENFRDGHYWTYNSAKAFAKLFPYFTERQIRYALAKLIDDGILLVANFNRTEFNNTAWYALTDKGRALLGLAPESAPDGDNEPVNDGADNGDSESTDEGERALSKRGTKKRNGSYVFVKPIDSYNNINNTTPDIATDNNPPIPPLSGNNASIIPSSGGYPPTGESAKANKPSEAKKPSERASVKRFVRPTADEVRAYCRERNNSVDAERFVDYYESKGWLVGKTPMKDWKAAVRTWERGAPSRGNVSQRDDARRWCFDAARVDDDPLPFG